MTATVTDWIAYAALRGTTVADDADSASALVRASDHITYHYLSRATLPVPEGIIDAAIYEAAALELATPGFWSRTYTPDQQKVLVAVGEIKWQVRGDASGAEAATPVSTKIEAMFRPYMVRVPGIFAV